MPRLTYAAVGQLERGPRGELFAGQGQRSSGVRIADERSREEQ